MTDAEKTELEELYLLRQDAYRWRALGFMKQLATVDRIRELEQLLGLRKKPADLTGGPDCEGCGA